MSRDRRPTPWMIGVGIVTFPAGPALEDQPAEATSTTVGGIVTVLARVLFIASFAFSRARSCGR